jgi:hypothetical protein
MKIFEHGLDYLTDTIKDNVHHQFDGAEEIGSSDISCCVRNVLKEFYENPDDAGHLEVNLVRNGVMNTLSSDRHV